MNLSRMIYTRHAHWYCDVLAALGAGGRLRTALVVISPHERRFLEFKKYRPLDERIEHAADAIVELYSAERWYRQPNLIKCGMSELTAKLLEMAQLEIPIRTDRSNWRLRKARKDFEKRASSASRRGAWSSGKKLQL